MTALPYRFRWNVAGRKSEPCKVTARSGVSGGETRVVFGAPGPKRFNTIRVEFADGFVLITSGNAIRRNPEALN